MAKGACNYLLENNGRNKRHVENKVLNYLVVDDVKRMKGCNSYYVVFESFKIIEASVGS